VPGLTGQYIIKVMVDPVGLEPTYSD
jgi:hypothetical protein